MYSENVYADSERFIYGITYYSTASEDYVEIENMSIEIFDAKIVYEEVPGTMYLQIHMMKIRHTTLKEVKM